MIKTLIPNGAEAVIAEYSEQVIKEYSGNPFIEALPPILSIDEVVDKLAFYPEYHPEERRLESHYRIHMIQRLFSVFQPLSHHLDLESRISRTIRQGYLARNPFRPSYAQSLLEGQKMIQSMNWELSSNENFRSSAVGFTTIGVSGMGKTTSFNRCLSLIPQIIVHHNYKGVKFSMYQLVWLKLDTPFDGSLRGLCIEFFLKVDSLLGTNYYQKAGLGRKSVDNMLAIMSQVARHTGLGLLVVDEIQHLSASKIGHDRLLNYFCTLVNTISVPCCLIGTTKALPILQSEFRQARRGSGQGDFVWDRLKKDENWDILMSAIWRYQWTQKETAFTEAISEALYSESQGIIDIAVKLYAMAQIRAIVTGIEEVTPRLIEKVAAETLQLVRPMLQALKTRNLKEIARFKDISMADIDFNEFILQSKQSIDVNLRLKALQKQKREEEKKSSMTKKEQAIIRLLELNIDAKKAQKAIDKVFETSGEEVDAAELAIKAIQLIYNSPASGKKKKATSDKKNEKDIRVIVEEARKNNITAYEALKQKGYIKSVENDFFMVG